MPVFWWGLFIYFFKRVLNSLNYLNSIIILSTYFSSYFKKFWLFCIVTINIALMIVWVQFSSVIQWRLTVCNPVDCSTARLPRPSPAPKFPQTYVHQIGDAIQPSYPRASPSPPAFPSIRVFSSESVLPIRWPNYWSFIFSICPSSGYSEQISFRTDWLDLLVIQGTLQHHSSKTSILQCSAFFPVKLSHWYTTTGKTIALTRQTFVGKVMSLLFNMLSKSS